MLYSKHMHFRYCDTRASTAGPADPVLVLEYGMQRINQACDPYDEDCLVGNSFGSHSRCVLIACYIYIHVAGIHALL